MRVPVPRTPLNAVAAIADLCGEAVVAVGLLSVATAARWLTLFDDDSALIIDEPPLRALAGDTALLRPEITDDHAALGPRAPSTTSRTTLRHTRTRS